MDDLAGDVVTRGNFHLFARPHPRTTVAAAWDHLFTCQRREFRGAKYRIPRIGGCWKIDYRGSLCPGWPCCSLRRHCRARGTGRDFPGAAGLPSSLSLAGFGKHALREGGTRFASRALPLCAIYVLGDRRSDSAPCVEAVRAQAALLSLVAETYANKILDREMRAREFEVLSRLVSAVPVRRVSPHEDATRLGELCKVIREDLDSLKLPRSAWP